MHEPFDLPTRPTSRTPPRHTPRATRHTPHPGPHAPRHKLGQVRGGDITATLKSNTGTISIADGVTGSLTLYEDSGTVTYPSSSDFTYTLKSWSSTKLTQTLTIAGITADALDDSGLQVSSGPTITNAHARTSGPRTVRTNAPQSD